MNEYSKTKYIKRSKAKNKHVTRNNELPTSLQMWQKQCFYFFIAFLMRGNAEKKECA
jgi:hypothetical protein